MFNKKRTVLIVLIMVMSLHAPASASTASEFRAILKYYQKRSPLFKKHAASFIKSHPRSSYSPSVYLMMAYDTDILYNAITCFKKILDDYPDYKGRSRIYASLLNLYFLGGSWDSLLKWSKKAIKEYNKNLLYRKYLLYAHIKKGRWDESSRQTAYLLNNNKSRKDHGQLHLQKAVILQNMTGLSKKYLTALAVLLTNFKEMDEYPAIILMTGDFYLENHKYNKAYSAYSDIIKQYPQSLEAHEARKKIQNISSHKPRYVSYIPEQKYLNTLDDIEIKHDRTPQTNTGSEYFSLSIGPLHSKKQLNDLKKILNEYGPVTTVRVNRNLYIYAGRLASTNRALSLKVRLAEEQGINSSIVRVSGKKVKYIYGE